MINKKIVDYESRDHIAIITMKRTEKLNAINGQMVEELHQAWSKFEKDENARVAIITGEGRSFSTGLDLDFEKNDFDIARAIPNMGVEVTKPIIAAVNGYCLGIGFSIALFSDIRIAADEAQFAYPEAKVGLTGGGGSLLAETIPLGVALEMLFTGSRISAKRAYEVGFVSHVFQKEKIMEESLKMAQIIADNAPLVVKTLKKLAKDTSIIKNAINSNRMISELNESHDGQEGLKAINEKRKPDFLGE